MNKDKQTDFISIWFYLALALAGALFLCVLVVLLGFSLGYSISWISGYSFFLFYGGISSILLFFVKKETRIKQILGSFIILILLVLSCYFSSRFKDVSFDGMQAHQDVIKSLDVGWIPLQDPYFKRADKLGNLLELGLEGNTVLNQGFKITTNHLLSSSINKITGNFESGKGVNFIFAILTFLVAMHCLLGFIDRPVERCIVATLITLNPVALYQSLSFCQDAIVACLLTCCLLMVIRIIHLNQIRDFALLIPLSVCLAFSKLTALAFLAFLTLFILFWVIMKFRRKPLFWIILFPSCVVFYVGMLVIGNYAGLWNYHFDRILPYEYSFIVKRLSFPFHVPGMSGIPEMENMNRLESFFRSVLSETHIAPGEFRLKWPFVVKKTDLVTFYHAYTAPRTGGFGPLYATALLLSLAGFIFHIRRYWGKNWVCLIPVFITIMSGVLFPTFWARWIPHCWLIPILLVLPLGKHEQTHHSFKTIKLFRFKNFTLKGVVFAILAANSMLVGIPYFIGNYRISQILTGQLEMISLYSVHTTAQFVWFPSNQRLLKDFGIESKALYLNRKKPQYMKLVEGQLELKLIKSDTRVIIDVDPDEWHSAKNQLKIIEKKINQFWEI